MTILKQLIENMIGDYLNESYEDDLVESVFEEVSEETWEAIEEAILNELSPALLKRYAAAADKSVEKRKPGESDADWDKRGDKRQQGADKAFDKIVRKTKKSPQIVKRQIERKDLSVLSSDEFQKKYRMSKAEWQRKNK